MAIRDRVKEFRRIPASEIKPNPKNWRTHPEQQSAALTAMLEDVGFAGAVLVRETGDGYELIDGHLRLDVMDGESVPAIVLDVNEQEADKLLLTLDPLSSLAIANEDMLVSLLDRTEFDSKVLIDFVKDTALQHGVISELQQDQTDQSEEYQKSGLPDFDNQDIESYHKVTVHFESEESISAFSKLVGQEVNNKTRFIYYPKQVEIKHRDKAYVPIE